MSHNIYTRGLALITAVAVTNMTLWQALAHAAEAAKIDNLPADAYGSITAVAFTSGAITRTSAGVVFVQNTVTGGEIPVIPRLFSSKEFYL